MGGDDVLVIAVPQKKVRCQRMAAVSKGTRHAYKEPPLHTHVYVRRMHRGGWRTAAPPAELRRSLEGALSPIVHTGNVMHAEVKGNTHRMADGSTSR